MPAGIMLALLAAPGASGPGPRADTHIVFSDATRDVTVRYDFTPGDVEFSARLTDGWSFSVPIDGDQNGVWGKGPEREGIGIEPTADREFGPTSHGALCAQYLLSSDPHDPNDVYSSSVCGALRSRAIIESTGVDPHDRALVTFRIPYEELFGDRPNAHLQICLWD